MWPASTPATAARAPSGKGRFNSALVDSDRYLLTCYRCIELNPVRAGRVPGPREYPSSSHARNAHGSHDPRVTPHVAYLRLGGTDDERQRAYPQRMAEALDPQDTAYLRGHTQQQRVWGSDRLRAQIEALTQRATTVRRRPRGRPRSSEK